MHIKSKFRFTFYHGLKKKCNQRHRPTLPNFINYRQVNFLYNSVRSFKTELILAPFLDRSPKFFCHPSRNDDIECRVFHVSWSIVKCNDWNGPRGYDLWDMNVYNLKSFVIAIYEQSDGYLSRWWQQRSRSDFDEPTIIMHVGLGQ